MEYLILTEASLPRLLWRIMMHRPTCVIWTMSLLRGAATGHLDWVMARFRGRVTRFTEEHPDWIVYPSIGDMIRPTNTFAEMEPWMEERLAFERSADRFGAYGVAYRHACSNAAYSRYEMGYRIKDTLDHCGDSPVTGCDAFDAAFQRERFGCSSPQLRHRVRLDRLINGVLTLVGLAFSLGWVASRTRLLLPPPTTCRLASDYVEHHTNAYLWDEISDHPHDVLLVFRSEAERKAYADSATTLDLPGVAATDGLFTLKGGLAAMGMLVVDSLIILRHGGGLPTDFFRRLIALPFRRVMYRGLFNRFRCLYFWGRDDYNSEHALRSVELRRAGGVPLGLMHGISSIADIIHQFRHIDFDIYYVHGRYLYERHYREKWPEKMRVRTIGSFGLSRQGFHRLADEARGEGVACFLSRSYQAEHTFAAILEVARAFPNRTFYVNVKSKELEALVYGPKLKNFLENLPDNVVHHSGRSYDLFYCCRTALTEGSTLAAEAVQFGLDTYVFDLEPAGWKVMIYREFPGICVGSAAEAIERMKSIEAGTWVYPRRAFASLIDMGGRIPWDVIREDMGLKPREGSLVPMSEPARQNC